MPVITYALEYGPMAKTTIFRPFNGNVSTFDGRFTALPEIIIKYENIISLQILSC
ncbi:MAG: hypothetical protein AAE975_00825 [Thermoplasmatales archaeon]|jgi:hypothetical protein